MVQTLPRLAMSITALPMARIVWLLRTLTRSFGTIRCILVSKLIVVSRERLSMW